LGEHILVPSVSFRVSPRGYAGTNRECRLIPGYIGEFEIIDDHRGGKIVIQLNGRLNKTGVISPRFNVGVDAIENWVNLLLPARSFGKIILTTSSGIMDHEEARRKHVSSFCFGSRAVTDGTDRWKDSRLRLLDCFWDESLHHSVIKSMGHPLAYTDSVDTCLLSA